MSGTDIPSHGRLYKAGRATHLTSGEDVGLRSVHIHRHIVQGKEIPVETYEHCIKGQRNTRFSRHGDSGAFIFDSQGCVVGLLFGGSEAKYTSYYTHIHDIFADIKEVTGATGVRIMGSVVTF